MVGARLTQILAADVFIAQLPVRTANIAALVAQKLKLVPVLRRKGAQPVKGFIQAEVRHDEAKFFDRR